MSNELLENYQKYSQAALENLKKIGEANLKLSEKLLQEQIGLTTALFEAASKTPVTEAKDLKDVAAWQTELAQEAAKKVVDASRNYAEIVAEAGKVYTGIFETTLKSAGCAGATCSTDKTAAAPRKTAA